MKSPSIWKRGKGNGLNEIYGHSLLLKYISTATIPWFSNVNVEHENIRRKVSKGRSCHFFQRQSQLLRCTNCLHILQLCYFTDAEQEIRGQWMLARTSDLTS